MLLGPALQLNPLKYLRQDNRNASLRHHFSKVIARIRSGLSCDETK
jgi:hypothetical protein